MRPMTSLGTEIELWKTNPATPQTIAANTNVWLIGAVGAGTFDTNGAWFDIDIPPIADSIELTLESELVDRGSFTGATPGTTHFAVGAIGYPSLTNFSTGAVKDRAGTPAVAFGGAAARDRIRGSILIGMPSDHAVNAQLLDGANVMKTSALIHTGVAPVNGDTVLSSFWLGRRTSVGNTIAPASTVGGYPGFMSIAGLRKISLSLTINYSAAWLPTPAADVLLRSRLYYKLFALQGS